MAIYGIDPDTHAITWAAVDGKKVKYGRVETKGRRAEDRFIPLIDLFWEEMEYWDDCEYVYVERPMVGPNRKAAIDMGMVVGAIRAVLDDNHHPHSLVDPGTWKKSLLGSGHASKDEIKAWVGITYGICEKEPQDVFDAAAIATFGARAMGKA